MQKIIVIFIGISSLIFSSEFQAMDNACDNHVSTACEELGYLYTRGEGVEKDRIKAKEYYLRACEYGFQKACNILYDFENEEK